MSENLTQLQKGKIISLKTYRKNGEGVASPLWFVEENLKFVVWTGADSFKVRRIKNNSEVQIASSNMSGKTKSNFIDAEARILTTDEIESIIMLFRKKYRIFRAFNYLKNRKKEESEKQVYIEITPK